MIIEDEEDILILYKDFLSGKGHDVTTMYLNGNVIIEEIDKARSDLYLIDYRLPGNKNGIDIATQILDKFPLAPILFITAHENLHKETSKNPNFWWKEYRGSIETSETGQNWKFYSCSDK